MIGTCRTAKGGGMSIGQNSWRTKRSKELAVFYVNLWFSNSYCLSWSISLSLSLSPSKIPVFKKVNLIEKRSGPTRPGCDWTTLSQNRLPLIAWASRILWQKKVQQAENNKEPEPQPRKTLSVEADFVFAFLSLSFVFISSLLYRVSCLLSLSCVSCLLSSSFTSSFTCLVAPSVYFLSVFMGSYVLLRHFF